MCCVPAGVLRAMSSYTALRRSCSGTRCTHAASGKCAEAAPAPPTVWQAADVADSAASTPSWLPEGGVPEGGHTVRNRASAAWLQRRRTCSPCTRRPAVRIRSHLQRRELFAGLIASGPGFATTQLAAFDVLLFRPAATQPTYTRLFPRRRGCLGCVVSKEMPLGAGQASSRRAHSTIRYLVPWSRHTAGRGPQRITFVAKNNKVLRAPQEGYNRLHIVCLGSAPHSHRRIAPRCHVV